jgi:hypothetical protein
MFSAFMRTGEGLAWLSCASTGIAPTSSATVRAEYEVARKENLDIWMAPLAIEAAARWTSRSADPYSQLSGGIMARISLTVDGSPPEIGAGLVCRI